MVNKDALIEIEKLEELYKLRWNKEVDHSLLPHSVTQEQLCLILRRIVDTGERCIVGYNKIKEISLKYYSQIDWSIQYKNDDIIKNKCPFCGNNVKISFHGTYNQSYVIYCETDFCLQIVSRGL